jgi:uncharacterized phage protein gp47/JayE
MPMSIEQLTRVVTEDEAVELILEELTGLKFNARAWQSGSVQLTIVRVFARVYANFTSVIAEEAKAGFNDTAEGDWLDVFSLSHYKNKRKGAVATEGTVRLVASATAPGPFVLGANDLSLVDTSRGLSFRNKDAFSINTGETVNIAVVCETPGAVGDVAPGAITIMRTPLAGVTASNPVPAGRTSWITKNGSDNEAQEALRERNRSKWGQLGLGSPALAYQSWAAEAHESVRRVFVDDQNPRGPDTLDVYIAGDSGPLSSVVVDQVQDFFEGAVDGTRRIAFGADLLIKSAVLLALPLKAQVYIQSSYNTRATQLQVLAAVQAYFKVMPIGGVRVTPDAQGKLPLGELYRAVLGIAGVRNIAFSAPAGDFVLEPNQVVVPVVMFAYVSI